MTQQSNTQSKTPAQNRKSNTKKTSNERLNDVMERIRLTEEGKTLIDGKYYTGVSKRNELFRKEFGFDVKIPTEILHMEDNVFVVKATILIKIDSEWEEVAVGHAEENRDQSQINQRSALENAETSAIGRALSNLGLSGGEFASSNEVVNAQQKPQKSTKMINKHQKQKIDQEINADKAFEDRIKKDFEVNNIDDLTMHQANEVLKKTLPDFKNKQKSKDNQENSDNNQEKNGDDNDDITLM